MDETGQRPTVTRIANAIELQPWRLEPLPLAVGLKQGGVEHHL